MTSNTEIKTKSYRRRIDLTDAIRQILNDYPMGSGIIRELIQNSDDAGAKSQILVLDHRTFDNSSLVEPVLERYQGPALLAFNDSQFTDNDWESLMSISNSKKKDDISKAGKFGLGFNAVHHITDAPSIISGPKLVLFDPHEDLVNHPGGCQLDFTEQHSQLQHQLSAFTSLSSDFSSELEGTIVRLPLRTAADALRSRIKKEKTTVADIRTLMDSFIQNELDIALLFLKHLTVIELREVLETGENRFLARAEIMDVPGLRPWTKSDDTNISNLYQLRVCVTTPGHNQNTNWLIRHKVGDLNLVNTKLTGRFPEKSDFLKEEKLYPHVAVALPLSGAINGRLFTSLPLPIETEFPVHVHALFALTTDRQSLKNPSEKTQDGSRENILQRWNTYLFQDLIADAWAHILEDAKSHTDDIYTFWPQTVNTGYWKRIDLAVFKHVLEYKLAIWPLYPADDSSLVNRFSEFGEALVDISDTDTELLSAISQAGIFVIRPPPIVLQSIKDTKPHTMAFNFVMPTTVSQKLKVDGILQGVQRLSPNMKTHILLYFLCAKAWNSLLGLPVIPLIDGSFVALGNFPTSAPSVIFASDIEVNLFRSLELRFFDRSLVRKSMGPRPSPVPEFPKDFVTRTDAEHFGLEHGCRLAISQTDMQWLSDVHKWADSTVPRTARRANRSIDMLPLPLVNGMTCPTQSEPLAPPVMESRDITPATFEMFQELNIPLLHKHFTPTPYLRTMRRITTSLDADVLLEWLEIRSTQITEACGTLRDTLHHHISHALRENNTLNMRWARVLQSLPVFAAYHPGISEASQPLSKVYVPFGQERFYIMTPSPEVLPFLPHHTFLDRSTESNERLIKAVDPKPTSGTPLELARLAAEHLLSQPDHLIDYIFGTLIVPCIYALRISHPSTFNKLRSTEFVTTSNGRQAPSHLLDPSKADICSLFLDKEGMLPTGLYARRDILDQLRAVSFFLTDISSEMVEERIGTYARNQNSPQVRICAGKLLDILDDLAVAIDFPTSIRQQPWIPLGPGQQLVTAGYCRDQTKSFLVSKVFHILPRTLHNPRLREALGWTNPPNSIIQQQFFKLVDGERSRDQLATLELLVPELARMFTEDECETLRIAVNDKAWIPIGNIPRPARLVYLSEDTLSLKPKFVRLPDTLRYLSQFYSRMGVPEFPRPGDLISALQDLTQDPHSSSRTEISIRLLEALSRIDLTPELQDLVVAPDTAGELRPLAELTFNDCRQRESMYIPGHWVDHRISEHVATHLGLKKASAFIVEDIADDNAFSDYEQYEALQDKIKNALRGYHYLSTCNEILANADDAKATEVCFMFDKRSFSETGALYPALHEVHGGPALVAYNDACFTEADWEGLSKLGVGGKTDRDTIGRFGLGALTYYHWTDVPLIVSGDYALFLDPSGEHLPAKTANNQRRRGLKINLRQCDHGRFDGTFQTLTGLFNFDPREFFRGTLIRLPLRRSESKLLDSTHEAPDVTKFLERCLDDARMAFLFTHHLQKITIGQMEAHGSVSFSASTTATREPEALASDYVSTLGKITSRQVIVSQKGHDQAYLVVKSTLPVKFFPSPIQQCAQNHRLSNPSVGLAYPILSKTREKMRLMSSLAIGNTDLPVHLHGEFILSSDRMSILMAKNPSDSLETRYNEFLLGKLAPPAYLFLIHLCLQHGHPTLGLWSKLDSPRMEVLAAGIYDILPEFSGALFETISTTHGKRHVAPKDSIFNHAASLTDFLRKMEVENLVVKHTLSPSIVPLASLQFDDAAWVKDLVERNGDKLQALFDDNTFPKFANNLIYHIISALGPSGLDGLRLLPTTKLHVFQHGHDVEKTFLFPSPRARKLFQFSRDIFITHISDDMLETILAEESGLNVRVFVPKTDLGTIMAQAFPDDRGLVHITEMKTHFDADWLPELKSYISEHKVPVDDLRPLPFIPLTHPRDHYISANSSNSSFAVRSPIGLSLSEAIMQLEGFHIFAKWSDLPVDLVDKPAHFNLSLFARWLLTNSWASLEEQTQNTLILEVMTGLEFNTVDGLLTPSSPLAHIPIWPSYTRDRVQVLKSADEILVLPKIFEKSSSITHYLVPLRHYVFLEDGLRRSAQLLGATVLESPADLIPYLSLPTRLEVSEISSFSVILANLMSQGGNFRHLKLVPNCDLDLCLASDLFDPGNDIFIHTLYPSQLLHPRFVAMTQFLIPSGLKSALTHGNLEQCIRAVHRPVGDPSVHDAYHRATCAYRAMQTVQPPPTGHFCQRIQLLSFIPRQSDDDSPAWRRPHLPRMERVVALSQLALHEHLQISWTQRASFEVEPSQFLRRCWETLCKPSIGEVVQHLVALAVDVARDVEHVYASNYLFIQDLRETYEFLQNSSNVEAVQHALSYYYTTPIFLNVVHPQGPWTWFSADSLVLDIDYDIPKQGLSHVQTFLVPYAKLLAAAGVKGISRIDNKEFQVPDDTPDIYEKNLLNGLDKLLKKCSTEDLTDITLVATRNPCGDNNIRAHKVVLAATNEWFSGKFSGNFQTTDTVELDVSFRTLQAIVDHFYGRNPVPEPVPPEDQDQEVIEYIQTVLDILIAADKFMLPALSTVAEKLLLADGCNLIRVTTAREILHHAKIANSDTIIRAGQKFIENNATFFDEEVEEEEAEDEEADEESEGSRS